MAKTKKAIDEVKELEEVEELEEEIKGPTAEERVAKDDDGRKMSCNPAGKFLALQLTGENRWRIVGKRKQWISGVMSQKDALILESNLNIKDPEQKAYNKVAKQGAWADEQNLGVKDLPR
jgi:hypothetical protein